MNKKIKYFKAKFSTYLIVILTMSYLAIFNVLFSLMVQIGLTNLNNIKITNFITYIIVFIFLALIDAIALYFNGLYKQKLSLEINKNLKSLILQQHFNFNNHNLLKTGDLQVRIMDDVTNIANLMCECILPLIQNILTIIFGIIYISIYAPIMIFTTIFISGLMLFINFKIANRLENSFIQMQNAEDNLNEFYTQYFEGFPTIYNFKIINIMQKINNKLFHHKYIANTNNAKAMAQMNINTEMFASIIEIINLILGIILVTKKQLTLAVLIGIWNVSIASIVYSIAELPGYLSSLFSSKVSFERLSQVNIYQTNTNKINKSIEVTLDDGNVWISGISGSGKTTILKNIISQRKDNYFYSPASCIMFPVSIKENITLDKPLKTNVEKLIKQFSINTWDNNRLSLGQQQLIAILRAINREEKLLFLDEPFSAMDPNILKKILTIITNDNNHTYVIVSHLPLDEKLFKHHYIVERGELYEK